MMSGKVCSRRASVLSRDFRLSEVIYYRGIKAGETGEIFMRSKGSRTFFILKIIIFTEHNSNIEISYAIFCKLCMLSLIFVTNQIYSNQLCIVSHNPYIKIFNLMISHKQSYFQQLTFHISNNFVILFVFASFPYIKIDFTTFTNVSMNLYVCLSIENITSEQFSKVMTISRILSVSNNSKVINGIKLP